MLIVSSPSQRVKSVWTELGQPTISMTGTVHTVVGRRVGVAVGVGLGIGVRDLVGTSVLDGGNDRVAVSGAAEGFGKVVSVGANADVQAVSAPTISIATTTVFRMRLVG